MKNRLVSLTITMMMLFIMIPAATLVVHAAAEPTKMWIEPSAENGIPSEITVFKVKTGGNSWNPEYTYRIFLPGNANVGECFLSWDNSATVTVNGASQINGSCPIPGLNQTVTYRFKDGNQTKTSCRNAGHVGAYPLCRRHVG